MFLVFSCLPPFLDFGKKNCRRSLSATAVSKRTSVACISTYRLFPPQSRMLLCAKSRSPFRLRQHKRKKWNYHPFSLHTRQTDVLFAVVAAKLLTTWLRIILLPPFLLTDIRDPPCNFLLFFFTAAHIAIVNALFSNVKQILTNSEKSNMLSPFSRYVSACRNSTGTCSPPSPPT